jgi:hypothetical protein
MSRSNPLWGAPRIHGELLKLGIEVSQTTVSKYMIRRHKPPSQNWRVFLKNHADDIISVDFFTVPTATFRVFFVFLILSNERRKVVHFIEQVLISTRSPWQNPYIERVIGSSRRECLNHTIIFNEKHLRRVLKEYFHYYDESRTHLGLERDCPEPRPTESAGSGPIHSEPMIGGLHHRYYRQAA